MSQKRDGHFLLVPLPLIRGLISNPNVIYKAYAVGLYCSSQKIEVDMDSLYVELVRAFYNPSYLGSTLVNWLIKLHDTFPYQKEWQGRDIADIENGKLFINIDKEIEFLKAYANEHYDFLDDCIEWWKVLQFNSLLDYRHCIIPYINCGIARNVFSEHPEYKDAPYIAVDNEVFINMLVAAQRSKPELRARWAMYLGMLSIIGTKEMAATTSVAIKSRMFGAKDAEELQQLLEDPETRALYDKWTTRRRYDRLMADIEEGNNVKSLGVGRRTYISYRFSTNQEISEAINRGDALKRVTAAKKERRRLLYELRKADKS